MKAHDNEIEAASADHVKWDHMRGYQKNINLFYIFCKFIKQNSTDSVENLIN